MRQSQRVRTFKWLRVPAVTVIMSTIMLAFVVLGPGVLLAQASTASSPGPPTGSPTSPGNAVALSPAQSQQLFSSWGLVAPQPGVTPDIGGPGYYGEHCYQTGFDYGDNSFVLQACPAIYYLGYGEFEGLTVYSYYIDNIQAGLYSVDLNQLTLYEANCSGCNAYGISQIGYTYQLEGGRLNPILGTPAVIPGAGMYLLSEVEEPGGCYYNNGEGAGCQALEGYYESYEIQD